MGTTFGHDILHKATHNLLSLNGSVLPVKHVVRTTHYTNTAIKLVPKIAKQLLIKSPFSSKLVGFGTPQPESLTLKPKL